MRRPCKQAAIASGSPPRRTRTERNSAERMRRPRSGAMERATVSTSGNSGMSGNLQENIAAFDFHFEGRDAERRIGIVLAGCAIKLPEVVWAHNPAVVNLSLAQGSSSMQANPAQRAQSSPHIADRVGLTFHDHFHHGIFREG